jgi:hypothetical protein
MFPSIREGLTFTRIDRDGFYIRKVGCEVCRYPEGHERAGEYRVVRVETWDVRTKRINGRPVIVRCDLLKAYTDYRDPEYLARAGQGRMKPKQIRGSMGTALMADVDPVALRKEVMAAVRATADIAPQEERGETA